MRKRLLPWFVAAPLLAFASATGATTRGGVFLGNDAALQAGAVTATASGGGAVWYNPAGLAQLSRGGIDGSLTGLALSLGKDSDLETDIEGAKAKRFSGLKFSAIPAALSYARRFGNIGIGFGVFVPRLRTTTIRTRLRTPPPSGSAEDAPPEAEFSLDLYSRFQEQYFGPALAFRLGPKVNIGVSLLGYLRTSVDISGHSARFPVPNGETVSEVSHLTLDETLIGIQPTVGVQVEPRAGWSLGWMLRSPTVRVSRTTQSINIDLLAIDPDSNGIETDLEDAFEKSTGRNARLVTPFQANMGLAVNTGGAGAGSTRWAVDATLDVPVGSQPDHAGPAVNVKLGVRHQWSKTLFVGGGLFTERGADEVGNGLGKQKINYWGISLATRMDTPYEKARTPGASDAAAKPLIVSTTIGLNYSLGTGWLERLDINSTDRQYTLDTQRQNVIEHELVLHIGSTLFD